MDKNLLKKSKFLSMVLRHRPETIGLALDENGWVNVEELLEASANAGQNISKSLLREIVATNSKQRFVFSSDQSKIRANQGHSVKGIDLELTVTEPPEILYHGTVEKFLPAIKKSGLQKMQRHHVHLSSTVETAQSVGTRRGKPVILVVHAAAMFKAGYEFYISKNDVWLTESVPLQYISI